MRNLKRVLSLALALVMVLGMMVIGTSAATYTDADQIEYKEAIAVMTGIGLYEGNPDGSLAPKQVLTRGMAATIMARIMLGDKVETLKATQQIFSDVAITDWYAPAVQYCFNTGLIDGNGDGTFNPNGELTGIAFAKLLLVALGYDADAQGYVGANWAANIAVDALTKDLYIKGVDIAEKLTREQAAQMILQVMDEFTVANAKIFDKSTGTYVLVLMGNTTTTFNDKYYEDLDYVTGNTAVDNWGRPYQYMWTYVGVRAPLWVETYAPVLKYTEAVTECDLAKDLGLPFDYPANVTINGNYAGVETIELLGTRNYLGAQGRLTEVYFLDNGTLDIVMIDTFLAKVNKVYDREFDKNGHLESAAELQLYVYDGTGSYGNTSVWLSNSYADYEYAKYDMLLVYAETISADDDTVANTAAEGQYVEILGYAEPVDGKLTSYNSYYATSKISGETYNWAEQYHMTKPGTVGKTYEVYTDLYGNLLGLDLPYAADNYTILDSGVFVTNGFRPYYSAKVLDLETGELVEVKVADYNDGDNVTYWVDNDVTNLNHIVKYDVYAAGYVMEDAADIEIASGCNIKTGVPRIYEGTTVKAVTNNYTTFVVEYAEGKFNIYTGYKAVPTIEDAANVEILMDSYNEYAELVYIDATGATYTGADDVVYALTNDVALVGSGMTEGYVPYDIWTGVVVDGYTSAINTVKGFDLSVYAGKAIKLFYNADGLVYKAAPYTFDVEAVDVEAISDEVVYFKNLTKGYILDESTVIWYVNNAAGYGTEGYLAWNSTNVYFDVAKDGKTLDFVVVVKD